jgi:hydroxymethylpyrimidine/phosphomethylpyrimidine kinase
MHTALTLNFSDPSGAAGLQADLKAFTVLGVYGMAAATAVHARNTSGPTAAEPLPAALVEKQLDALAEDFPVHALKTGALATLPTLHAVAAAIRRHSLAPFVCDPSLDLLGPAGNDADRSAAVHAYRKELFPLAAVATPNRAEAALLANMDPADLTSLAAARKAAEKIVRAGCPAVVIKGLADGDRITDLFFDGRTFIEFPAKRLTTRHTAGAGTLFSAVIAGMLAQQTELPTAIDHARSFVSQAIEHHVKFGGGTRPVNVLALTP